MSHDQPSGAPISFPITPPHQMAVQPLTQFKKSDKFNAEKNGLVSDGGGSVVQNPLLNSLVGLTFHV